MQPELTGPSWPLDHTGEYFLVIVYPDGTASVDGGHGTLEEVAKARKLHQRIFNKPGAEFRAIQVVAIPDEDVPINDEAAAMMASLVQKHS
jgi:hypothetical protein